MDYFGRGRNYQFDAVGEWQGKLVWQFGELRQLVTLLQFPPPNLPALPPPIVPPPLTFPLNFYGAQSSAAYQAICLLIYTTVFWMDPTR